MEIKTKDRPECIARIKELVNRLVNHAPVASSNVSLSSPSSSDARTAANSSSSSSTTKNEARLLEDFAGKLRFALPGSPTGVTNASSPHTVAVGAGAGVGGWTLSHLFSELESNRIEYNIEDYIISQATLEQVFLSFAKHQDESHVL
jgi:hypothetical protein